MASARHLCIVAFRLYKSSLREVEQYIHWHMEESIDLKDIIRSSQFRFNKALGQNFISDKNLLAAIVSDSGICEDDVVVEIGTGGGTLTRALAQKARRVISFEIDKNLMPVLDVSLKGLDNTEVVFKDVLRMSDDDIVALVGGPFKVVANLPYYVTTPMIMRFLESSLDVETLTVMVQKEVADRLVARVGSADYAAITLAVQMMGKAYITRQVSRKMFFPMPNVDSSVIRIDIDKTKLGTIDKQGLRKLIRASFAMRRKTLANNLSAAYGFSKDDATSLIVSAGFGPLVRGEALSLDDYLKLFAVGFEGK